jgi:hypothetical protein
MKGYGICRVRRVQNSGLKQMNTHNNREYTEENRPVNVLDNSPASRYGSNTYSGNIIQAVNDRLKETGVKVRKNSVVALEFVLTAGYDSEGLSSKHEFFERYSADGFFHMAEGWLKSKYGDKNVVAKHTHYDETNPHAHFVVVPVVEKEVRWKNARGEGVKKELRLSADDLMSKKEHYRQLQDDYHKFIEPIGKAYGYEFIRGSKAIEGMRAYSKATNHQLGQIDIELRQLREMLSERRISSEKAQSEMRKLEKEKEIKNKQLQKTQSKIKEVEKTKKKNWKRGNDFGRGF